MKAGQVARDNLFIFIFLLSFGLEQEHLLNLETLLPRHSGAKLHAVLPDSKNFEPGM